MKISLLTTKTTIKPLTAVIKEAGTPISRCIFWAPTSSPPKNAEAGIAPMGFSPPKSAATMPLKPAAAVKPAGEPSVCKRYCKPSTCTTPAKPAKPPAKNIDSIICRLTLMPA